MWRSRESLLLSDRYMDDNFCLNPVLAVYSTPVSLGTERGFTHKVRKRPSCLWVFPSDLHRLGSVFPGIYSQSYSLAGQPMGKLLVSWEYGGGMIKVLT